MIEPKVKPTSIDDEIEELKTRPKEAYIDLDAMGGSANSSSTPPPEFVTEDEFREQREAEEVHTANPGKYMKAGKLAFNLTDVVIPRAGAAWTGASHKELRADPEDRQDIIDAYTAVFEYYDWDFDNPVLALILILSFSYGPKIVDAKAKAKERKNTEDAHAEEVHDDAEEVEQEDVYDDAPPPGTPSTVQDAEVILEPVCAATDCGNKLKPGQKLYCSAECRVKGLNPKKKK